DLLGAVEQVEHAVAAAELEPRPGEVVARIRLDDRTRVLEPAHGALEQRQGVLGFPGLEQRVCRVVQLGRTAPVRRPRGLPTRRGGRRRDGSRDRVRAGGRLGYLPAWRGVPAGKGA